MESPQWSKGAGSQENRARQSWEPGMWLEGAETFIQEPWVHLSTLHPPLPHPEEAQ